MIIYKGYYYFKKALSKIIRFSIFNKTHGSIGSLGESYIICVKKDDPLEDQIKTILHELAHLGLEGKNFDEIDPELNKSLILGRLSLEQKKLIVKIERMLKRSLEIFMEEIRL